MAEVKRPGQIVLHFCWTEDYVQRQETYGPWAVTEDGTDYEQIHAFLDDWKRLTGIHPHVVTMALVTDPGEWVRQRKGSDDD